MSAEEEAMDYRSLLILTAETLDAEQVMVERPARPHDGHADTWLLTARHGFMVATIMLWRESSRAHWLIEAQVCDEIGDRHLEADGATEAAALRALADLMTTGGDETCSNWQTWRCSTYLTSRWIAGHPGVSCSAGQMASSARSGDRTARQPMTSDPHMAGICQALRRRQQIESCCHAMDYMTRCHPMAASWSAG
jgi:hypothetical protein